MTLEKVNPGDYVEVDLIKDSYKGFFLDDSENKGVALIKLDSGYNVGFNRKDILNLKLINKASANEDLPDLKKSSDRPNVAMIITGGTIAAKMNSRKGGVDWLDEPKSLFKFYPEIFDLVNISKVEVPFMKASEDMDFKDWQKIAKTVKKLLNDSNIKGVIITHGTDFLHYTSSMLGFFLKDLNKPVVLTYSQKSIDRASSDANLNLKCAALAAISEMAEVMLVGHGTINDNFCFALPGNKSRKMHSSRRDAFKAVNEKPFAKIFEDRIEIIRNYNKRDNKKKVKLDLKFENKVALIKFYPGQNPDFLDYYVKKKYKGLVIEASGLGHLPSRRSRNSWIKKLKEIQDNGITVCITTQTIYGRVDGFVYSNGREVLKTGAIYLEDMLPETAFVKLGWVLGHGEWIKSKEIIRQKMLENISGEFNERLEV
ncbi:MAG: Glu-tRNA(Gln) amidotransferase subunit GatD [Candidatus Pacearchaeota archaeon]